MFFPGLARPCWSLKETHGRKTDIAIRCRNPCQQGPTSTCTDTCERGAASHEQPRKPSRHGFSDLVGMQTCYSQALWIFYIF